MVFANDFITFKDAQPENSGWKFKWCSSFHWQVSEKYETLQTKSTFPVPTAMTGKFLYHLYRASITAFRYCFLSAARDSGLAKRHTRKILYHYERSIPTGFSVQMVNAPVLTLSTHGTIRKNWVFPTVSSNGNVMVPNETSIIAK